MPGIGFGFDSDWKQQQDKPSPGRLMKQISLFIIYFINHYLSASLLQPSGVKHDMCDRLSHVNE